MTWQLEYRPLWEPKRLFDASDFQVYRGARLVRCPNCLRKKRYDARQIAYGFLFIEHEIECPNLDCCTWFDPMTERATVSPIIPDAVWVTSAPAGGVATLAIDYARGSIMYTEGL